MSTQSLDSDIYDYGFILNSTALHEAAMSVLVTTITVGGVVLQQ